MKRYVKIFSFWIVMLLEKDNILEFNQYMKSDKMLDIIYADIESLIKKIDRCKDNPDISSTTKAEEHIPCRYSESTIWVFDHIKNKHTLYCGEDFLKRFCTSLRENATKLINFEKKKMLPLTKKELKLHQDATDCYICGKRFLRKFVNDKDYWKVRDHFTGKYRGAADSICNLRFNVSNKIPVVFHNGSNYDYYFIIKD